MNTAYKKHVVIGGKNPNFANECGTIFRCIFEQDLAVERVEGLLMGT